MHKFKLIKLFLISLTTLPLLYCSENPLTGDSAEAEKEKYDMEMKNISAEISEKGEQLQILNADRAIMPPRSNAMHLFNIDVDFYEEGKVSSVLEATSGIFYQQNSSYQNEKRFSHDLDLFGTEDEPITHHTPGFRDVITTHCYYATKQKNLYTSQPTILKLHKDEKAFLFPKGLMIEGLGTTDTYSWPKRQTIPYEK